MSDLTHPVSITDVRRRPLSLIPGLVLCVAITLAAYGLQGLEARLSGRAWFEAVVLAILLGALLRAAWTPGRAWAPGIAFSAKTVLEIAIVLLGATVDARSILGVGAPLLVGIAGVVAIAIGAGFGLGRLFGLPRRMAILIACGNAVCGNSAIAAVAPVIGADGEDVAAAIAFTAALGVGVVLGLPLVATGLQMSHQAFGVFAGLTVYAVPQVLAATAPVSPLATQVGTVVKLMRVMMLGPVVSILSVLTVRRRAGAATSDLSVAAGDRPRRRPPLPALAPWFIVGFAGMVAARTVGLVPQAIAGPAAVAAGALTVTSMAALGLGVDMSALAKAGVRVGAVVVISLAVLALLSLALLRVLGLAQA